jgi:hypothetical protein
MSPIPDARCYLCRRKAASAILHSARRPADAGSNGAGCSKRCAEDHGITLERQCGSYSGSSAVCSNAYRRVSDQPSTSRLTSRVSATAMTHLSFNNTRRKRDVKRGDEKRLVRLNKRLLLRHGQSEVWR